jgi:hypothetical protein
MTNEQSPYGGGASRLNVTAFDCAPHARSLPALVARAAALAAEGAQAKEMLFVVPRASQKDAVRFELQGALGGAAGEVAVRSVLEVAQDLLETPQARRTTGRVPRILTHIEETVLNEDLKTLGIQTKRLREMLKYLRKGPATLESRNEDWLIMAEEVQVVRKQGSWLAATGAMLADEAPSVALDYLESAGAEAAVVRFDHVFVDGWCALNRASQRLVQALAACSLSVTVNRNEPGVALLPHRNARGLDELLGTYPQATVSFVPDAPAPRRSLVSWPEPKAEFEGVAAWAAGLLTQGVDPCEVAVAVPNRAWANRVVAACKEAGVPTSVCPTPRPLAGDPRVVEHCASQRAFALVMLAADQNDLLAWRLWCGFGDWLLNSMAWQGLEGFAEQTGTPTLAALFDVAGQAGEPFAGAARLAAAVQEARDDLARLRGLGGFSLVCKAAELVGARVDELATLVAGVDERAEAPEVARALRQAVLCPAFDLREPAVRIGYPEALRGVRVDHLTFCGLVDGFMPGPSCFDDRLPPDVKERNLAHDRAVFELATSGARRELVLSCFEQEWLCDAEPARMEVRRIRAEAKGRRANIWPSRFLEGADASGDAWDTSIEATAVA